MHFFTEYTYYEVVRISARCELRPSPPLSRLQGKETRPCYFLECYSRSIELDDVQFFRRQHSSKAHFLSLSLSLYTSNVMRARRLLY